MRKFRVRVPAGPPWACGVIGNMKTRRTIHIRQYIIRGLLFSSLQKENAMYERTPKTPVNLVRRYDEDAYSIVSDGDMMHLKSQGRVFFEKSREDNKFIGSFYILKE